MNPVKIRPPVLAPAWSRSLTRRAWERSLSPDRNLANCVFIRASASAMIAMRRPTFGDAQCATAAKVAMRTASCAGPTTCTVAVVAVISAVVFLVAVEEVLATLALPTPLFLFTPRLILPSWFAVFVVFAVFVTGAGTDVGIVVAATMTMIISTRMPIWINPNPWTPAMKRWW